MFFKDKTQQEVDQLTEEETQPKGVEKAAVQDDVASIEKPSAQNNLEPFIDDEEIPEYYSNILGVRTGPYDVELVFGLNHPTRGPKALVRVRTSQKHFQAIGDTIARILKEQEPAS